MKKLGQKTRTPGGMVNKRGFVGHGLTVQQKDPNFSHTGEMKGSGQYSRKRMRKNVDQGQFP